MLKLDITMTMSIQGLEGENGRQAPQVNPLPTSAWGSDAYDPHSIETLANQLYSAVPGSHSGANQVHQAKSVGETTTTMPHETSTQAPAVTIPSSPAVPAAPATPATGTEIPAGQGVTGITPTSADPLGQIIQQLHAQMYVGNLDSAMKQAIAGLSTPTQPAIGGLSTPNQSAIGGLSTPSQPAIGGLSAPTQPAMSGLSTPSQPAIGGLSTPNQEAVAQPKVATVPSSTFSQEALNGIAQQMLQSVPQLFGDPTQKSAVTTPGLTEAPGTTADQSNFYFISTPQVEKQGLKSDTPFDVHIVRQDFPILHQKVNGKPLIWLDNAATTQKPQSVIDSISRFYERDNSNIHRAAHTLAARATDAYEAARETVQRFLGASSKTEIIFARGTTEAINLVAKTYGRQQIRKDDEIILSTLEHHANIVPWQMLAQETGAILKVIPVNQSGEVILEEYARLLGPRTRIVAVTHVSNALGTILPVQEITHMAHRHGAIVLIDGAQGIPHLSVNVQALDCDFYTFSGHKLFGPTGIGVLYGKQELLETMPPWQGGGSMIRHVTFEHTVYEDPPAKFEAGTPNIADAVGLGAAIDYITRLGMVNLERYEQQLTEYATERLLEIPGLRLIGTAAHKVGVLSFVFDDIPPETVGKRLDQEGIAVRAGHHCAQPTMQRYNVIGTVRPSLAFYNTYEEIDTLVEVLRNLRYR